MQFGPQNPPIKIPTEEDSLNFIVRALRDTKVSLRDYGYDVSLPHIFDLYLNTVCAFQDRSSQQRAYKEIAPLFYAAAWELCRRGILRPGIRTYGVQEAGAFVDGYSITPAGARWIKDAGQYDASPHRIRAVLQAT